MNSFYRGQKYDIPLELRLYSLKILILWTLNHLCNLCFDGVLYLCTLIKNGYG